APIPGGSHDPISGGGSHEVCVADLRCAWGADRRETYRRRRDRRLGGVHPGGEERRSAGGRGAAAGGRHRHHRAAARRRAAVNRRSLHRDQGASAGLLPRGGNRPGRGHRLGGADAAHSPWLGGGPAGAAHPWRGPGRAGMSPAALERAYREEWAAVVATLARRLGDLQRAEDATQEAFATAAVAWPRDGVPAKPGAWLTVTAWRKALDQLRRDRLFAERARDLQGMAATVEGFEEQEETLGMEDDRLRLIFTCCHPALALEVRVALTLRYLAGLTTREIASAFL